MKWIRSRLSYANVMATIAVFIALGGVSYAATQLPKNSVGAKQLRKGSVTGAKIKNGAISPAKLNRAARAATVGPQGPQGPKGDPGSARAWAEVAGDGTIVRSFGGVTGGRIGVGRYCLSAPDLGISNSVALVSANYGDVTTAATDQIAVITTELFNECPSGSNEFMVRAVNSSNDLSDVGFIFAIP